MVRAERPPLLGSNGSKRRPTEWWPRRRPLGRAHPRRSPRPRRAGGARAVGASQGPPARSPSGPRSPRVRRPSSGPPRSPSRPASSVWRPTSPTSPTSPPGPPDPRHPRSGHLAHRYTREFQLRNPGEERDVYSSSVGPVAHGWAIRCPLTSVTPFGGAWGAGRRFGGAGPRRRDRGLRGNETGPGGLRRGPGGEIVACEATGRSSRVGPATPSAVRTHTPGDAP